MSSKPKENTYKVVWQHSSFGKVYVSAEIDVLSTGDVVMEHITVLTKFHAIFEVAPPPVNHIIEVRRVRKRG